MYNSGGTSSGEEYKSTANMNMRTGDEQSSTVDRSTGLSINPFICSFFLVHSFVTHDSAIVPDDQRSSGQMTHDGDRMEATVPDSSGWKMSASPARGHVLLRVGNDRITPHSPPSPLQIFNTDLDRWTMAVMASFSSCFQFWSILLIRTNDPLYDIRTT